MIVYQGTKSKFLEDADNRNIEDVISSAYLKRTGKYAPHAETRAWQHSLTEMARVLRDKGIDDDIGVGVEFGIPQTAKRIDFVLTGHAENGTPHVVIVELKQWSTSRISEKDGIVWANRGGSAEREGPHPSYQAWSYAALLTGFNEAVYESNTALKPCAYLHNYTDDGVIRHPHYAAYLDKAPVFLRGEDELAKLRAFIRQHVRTGDKGELLYEIEAGRIRPSKMLADSLAKMLKGNREFVLVDDQKLVYETCLAKAAQASDTRKQVVIVKGGPGTGKSVVAVNLLVELTKRGQLTKYVSKNAAPRAVYKQKLAGQLRQVEIGNLFSGSGTFHEGDPNVFDTLVVDEAHRLNEKSGLYGNLGQNQIMELIRSARCTVFFADDDQIVTLSDIGRIDALTQWAQQMDAEVTQLELASQFRCAGSDGYIAWLDNFLGIRETANADFDRDAFDFRIVDSPVELHNLIREKNQLNNKARVVAGYCWDWKSKKNPDAWDIEIPEHDYQAQWNLDKDGSLWIIAPDSVEQVGCIHTCQGLELDYVGVIIGPDLRWIEGKPTVFPESRSRMDRSVRGWKKKMKQDPDATRERLELIVRNTYKTLMSRGMKGCYIHLSQQDKHL
ncbi:ATP-binding protein [Pseudoxanthomonas jiangsuensis]|uniref:DNA/RNA helicase domain-containing protein n=1 Tax=Pseudoxanthomonas jiangsuensis TaxID=619688 RepID=UPI00139151CE|nr:DNA/RNA helicase domain-containing protein [Pseudoxanthomonas jiangsuensis]KAF1695194.1 ATP-binding protein [Pseudoxanthomonas jiangsuensis]